MLTDQDFSRAMDVERAMYRSLSELEELTQELAQAADRGDKVSVQMSLAMRRDPLEQVARHQAALRRQYTALPAPDARLLRALLEEASPPAVSGAEALVRQAARNRTLLARIVAADWRINQKVAGRSSFYAKRP